ncbi:MAG: NAD(P)-binding protein, partial [Candidatus Omnitrophica bacterium]|nr:NAD(P)-binding protein [Candidatus Omnitrophota bacterium]
MANQKVIETDILIIGGGVAGLATAIHLADLHAVSRASEGAASVPPKILVLEKGSSVGSHSLSGAVVDSTSLRQLLPGMPEQDFPFESPVTQDRFYFLLPKLALRAPYTPPFMGNRGNYVVALGKLTRWLAEIAEK